VIGADTVVVLPVAACPTTAQARYPLFDIDTHIQQKRRWTHEESGSFSRCEYSAISPGIRPARRTLALIGNHAGAGHEFAGWLRHGHGSHQPGGTESINQ